MTKKGRRRRKIISRRERQITLRPPDPQIAEIVEMVPSSRLQIWSIEMRVDSSSQTERQQLIQQTIEGRLRTAKISDLRGTDLIEAVSEAVTHGVHQAIPGTLVICRFHLWPTYRRAYLQASVIHQVPKGRIVSVPAVSSTMVTLADKRFARMASLTDRLIFIARNGDFCCVQLGKVLSVDVLVPVETSGS